MRLFYGLAGAACIAYYLILGLWARFGLSLSWMWLLFGAVFLGACALSGRVPMGVVIAGRTALCLALAVLTALLIPIFSGMTAHAPENLEYLIVLGARVNEDGEPSLSLQHRIRAAAEYWKENPDTILIASGGQGRDEPFSEAECIRRELLAAGVAEDKILLEDQSTSTAENLRFSRALMRSPDASVGIVTNNFHVYRAVLHARHEGLTNVHGAAAAYIGPTLPHYLVREAICLVVGRLTGNL